MLKLAVLLGLVGISFILIAILVWDGGNIQIFDIDRLGEYIYSLRIETTELALLTELLDELYLAGLISEFLTPYYYIFVILLSLGLSFIFFSLYQYFDYIVMKKRLFLPNIWPAARRSFYVLIAALFYFYTRLANLSFEIFVAFCILIICFELLIHPFVSKKSKDIDEIKQEKSQDVNPLEDTSLHQEEV